MLSENEVPEPDVVTIRGKTGLSQPAFAKSIGIPLGTLKNWEQGRRRRLTSKAPATKAAFKAEQELFRLRRELQRLDLENPESAPRREALPEVRRGGKVIDIERLRR